MLFPFCYLSLINTPLYRWWQAEDVNIKNTNPPHVEDPSVHCSCFYPQTHSTALIIFNYVNNIFVKFCVAGRLRPFRCAVSCMYFVRGRHVCFGGDFCFLFFVQGLIFVQAFQPCLRLKHYFLLFLVLYIIYDLAGGLNTLTVFWAFFKVLLHGFGFLKSTYHHHLKDHIFPRAWCCLPLFYALKLHPVTKKTLFITDT